MRVSLLGRLVTLVTVSTIALGSMAPALATGACGDAVFGPQSDLVLDTDTFSVYRFLEEAVGPTRTSESEVLIPVYVSVPLSTDIAERFTLIIDGRVEYELKRVDPVNLFCLIPITGIPATLEIVVRANDAESSPSIIHLSNRFQAITVPFEPDRSEYEDAVLPAEYVRGTALRDGWGSFMYGLPSPHRRYFTESTIERAALLGTSDVYLYTFLEFENVLSDKPGLRLVGGDASMSREDFALAATSAHANGQRVHILLVPLLENLSEEEIAFLRGEKKEWAWLEALWSEYAALLIAQAQQAEETGIDGLLFDWLIEAVNLGAHEIRSSERARETVSELRRIYCGLIEFSIATHHGNVLTDELPRTMLEVSDVVHWANWEGAYDLESNTIKSFYDLLAPIVCDAEEIARIATGYFIFHAAFQCTDSFFVEGWADVAIGNLKGGVPDFFQQARAYEALLQCLSRSNEIDGVVFFKYDFDDPFGPELGPEAFARMDLSASIRNKPAEAVIKRWFRGQAGPTSPLPNLRGSNGVETMTDQPDLILSVPFVSIDELYNSHREIRLSDISSSLDDPEFGVQFGSKLGRPTATSYVELTWSANESIGGVAQCAFQDAQGLKLGLWGFASSIDAASFDGILIILWTEGIPAIEVELLTSGVGYTARAFGISNTPSIVKVPFDAMSPYGSQGSLGVPDSRLRRVSSIGFFTLATEGKVQVGGIGFYSDSERD